MCGGIHYGVVEGLVSVERWSCASCVVKCSVGKLKASVETQLSTRPELHYMFRSFMIFTPDCTMYTVINCSIGTTGTYIHERMT